MTTKEQIIYKYKTANALEKLIGLNILFFVLSYIFRAFFFLIGISSNYFVDLLVFPKQLSAYIKQPWSIISYAFIHAGFLHLLFNLIILHFGGRIFLNYYSGKKLINYYVLGAIFGALLYMFSYNFFPAFSSVQNSYLIGASASVMAVFIGISTKVPNLRVRLFLLGDVKLWWVAVFFLFMDILQIPLSNSGGHIAHLGGALIGYLYTKQLDKGNDIGRWVEKIIQGLQSFFTTSTKAKARPKSKMKTVYKKNISNSVSKSEKQKKIDNILDKISKSGYDSLTKEEKDFLFTAGSDS